jgi:NADH dehydrogenase FAD-containing subunit
MLQGSIEPRSIIEPIRKANPEAEFYEASCEEIFPENKTVRVRTALRLCTGV